MRLRGKGLLVLLAVCVAALGLAACVADPPPRMVGATAGNQSATVTWLPPLGSVSGSVVAYDVQAYGGSVGLPAVRFNSAATAQTITGLVNGSTYTFHVRAIDSVGNDSAWSEASNAVTPVPPTPVALDVGSSGSLHSCAVLSDGTAGCWGANSTGQLGNGTTTGSSTPVAVTGIGNATAISAGGDPDDNGGHTCARLTSGTVKCWGNGNSGQLGNGSYASSSTPVAVTGITNATAVAAGLYHSCALLTDGTVNCWGAGAFGMLGNGSSADAVTPVVVTGITTATAISAGILHTCALLTDGTVKCWGHNGFGQLGNDDNTNRSTPQTVTGITTATAISTGGGHTCALLTDGTLRCWGSNSSGQLGNGTTTDSWTAVPVTGIATAVSIDAGWYQTCALLTGGAAYCWGGNFYGQLGNGTTTESHTPVPVTGITTAVVIDGEIEHTCALLTDDTVKCWGGNNYGQLGNGTTTNSTTPVTVIGL